mgnify:FL=1
MSCLAIMVSRNEITDLLKLFVAENKTLIMAYRKGYFRKDGTYVQGHFTNHRSKGFSPKKGNGCMLLLAPILFVIVLCIL